MYQKCYQLSGIWGQLDELLEPYIDTVDEGTGKEMLKLFLLDGPYHPGFLPPRKHRAA